MIVRLAKPQDISENGGKSRRGFSLLEVVVALAIFLFTIISVGQMIGNASDTALDVKYQDQANMLCQAKLAEVMVGAVPLASSDDFTEYEEKDYWQWKVEAEPYSDLANLYQVKVTVQFEFPGRRMVQAQLSQLVFQPLQKGSTSDRPIDPATGAPAGTTTGGIQP